METKATLYALTLIPWMVVAGGIMLGSDIHNPFAWITILFGMASGALYGYGEYAKKRELEKKVQNNTQQIQELKIEYDRKFTDLENRFANLQSFLSRK